MHSDVVGSGGQPTRDGRSSLIETLRGRSGWKSNQGFDMRIHCVILSFVHEALQPLDLDHGE